MDATAAFERTPPDPEGLLRGQRDLLFAQLALQIGLIDRSTLDQARGSQTTLSTLSLAEILVRSGLLSEQARQGLELLLNERLARSGTASLGDASSLADIPAPGKSVASLADTVPLAPGAGGSKSPQKMFGHYELLSEIARGGMGVVYKARQVRLNRLVALKMIRAGEFANAQEVQRFYAEAEAAARLDHPGIAPVYEVGEVAGQHFFSMAFVQGQSLNSKIKTQGPLVPKHAAQLLRTVATAVQYAHDKGIVHRDIKPHNILLDENEQPRVADFGLAKQVQGASDLTTTGQVMGTPSYMPPEQATGRTGEIGPAADVYSLGATLYCLLTGRPPFQASSLVETIRQVLDLPPVPPHRLNSEIPRDLETICLKCLRKEPENRYRSAGELADDLGRFVNGEPILARPVGALERGLKWVQRRPLTATLSALSILGAFALVAAGVSIAYQVRLTGLNETLESAQKTLEEGNKSLGAKNIQLDDAQKKAAAARDEANKQRDAAKEAKKLLADYRYASDMALAGRAWGEGDVSRMLALLNRLVPQAGEADLRGFEWHYLRTQEQSDLWRGQQGYSALSSNGKYLGVVTEQGVRLLDPRTRKVLREFPGIAAPWVNFAFSRDSQRLIVPLTFQEVVVWDVEQGTELIRLTGDDLQVTTVVLSPDGTMAATSGQGDDHAVHVWDVATGVELRRWDFGGYSHQFNFSPDGKHFALLVGQSSIQVHNLTEKTLAYTISQIPHEVSQLMFHPTGNWLMAACKDDQVLFWNAANGSPEAAPLLAKHLAGNAIDVSPDGARILTGVFKDNTVRLWDGITGRLLSTRKGHGAANYQVFFSYEDQLALSVSGDGTQRLWDMRGRQDVEEIPLSISRIGGLRFSPDGQTLAFHDDSGVVYLYSHRTLRPLPKQDGRIGSLDFTSDGKHLLAATSVGPARVWDVTTGQPCDSLGGSGNSVFDFAINGDGTLAATVESDHMMRVWNLKTSRQMHQFPLPTTNNGIVTAHFQPRTDLLISAQTFEGYQAIKLGEKPQIQNLKGNLMTYGLTFSPEGSRVAAPGGSHSVEIWSFPELKMLRQLQGHTAFISKVAFTPDGRRLASLSHDQSIKIWDLATGQELLTLPCEGTHTLAMSPDGRRIASARDDGTILIWNTVGSFDEPPLATPLR